MFFLFIPEIRMSLYIFIPVIRICLFYFYSRYQNVSILFLFPMSECIYFVLFPISAEYVYLFLFPISECVYICIPDNNRIYMSNLFLHVFPILECVYLLQNLRRNRGMCGTCGDPYQGPREHEAGGKYALGIITRSYPANQRKLPVKVVLTAYHKGYYEFKICPHNNPNIPVSQRCLNRYPLRIVEGSRRYRTRYYPKRNGVHRMTLMLPRGLRCSQCVLQWRYRTGMHQFK